MSELVIDDVSMVVGSKHDWTFCNRQLLPIPLYKKGGFLKLRSLNSLIFFIVSIFTVGCGSTPVKNSPLPLVQSSPWSPVKVSPALNKSLSELGFIPNKYSVHILDEARMLNDLKTANQIKIPMAEGNLLTVLIRDSSVMSPELAAKYPTIRSFKAKAIDRSAVFGNLGANDLGFHAMLFVEGGHRVFIDKRVINNNRYYLSYLDKNYHPLGKPHIKGAPHVLKRN